MIYTYPDHFLDTNILISSCIYWDRKFSDAVTYMGEDNIQRYTSALVHNEADVVFNSIRNNIRYFLITYLGNNLPVPPNTTPKVFVAQQTSDFENKCKTTPTRMFNKKTWGAMDGYIRKHRAEIENAVSAGKSELINLSKDAGDIIQGAIDYLYNNCKNDPAVDIYEYPGCPCGNLTYNGHRALHSALFDHTDPNKINNESDVYIILDSFYVKNHINKDIQFVTYDKDDIINHRALIERTLKGIFVIEPVY